MDDRYLNHPYVMAACVIDPVHGTVNGHGAEHALGRKPLEVLALLASADGQTVTREAFIEEVWDGDRLVGERGLTDAIYALRRSLQGESEDSPLIRTIPRRGYQLHAPIRFLREGEDPSGAQSALAPAVAPLDPTVAVENTTTHPMVGSAIGPFHILDVLGEGGMGTVFLAEQRHPVERQVAVKAIKAGMDSELVLARFEAERQALALMDHDHVATVYDAGTTATGHPYFAMELVHGLAITEHCDRFKLPLRARIELFLQVCDGVQHAHQKGLIHRDLKPSNILVKRPAGQPATVKIIDFGVAKSLQRKLSTRPAHTRLGTYVGTPCYSSPEQISDHLPDADTRADVYSLGIVLYELLVGATPHGADELADKASADLVKILGCDPPPPATRFAGLDRSTQETAARARSESITSLDHQLRADLSWIVVQCLEPDPDDRYPSVLELKKDLVRWLEDRPIEARPTTWPYRAGKWMRRHWVAVTLVTLITVALVATTTGAIVGFVRAEREAAKAQAAAREAETAADFQVDRLRAIDPAVTAIGLRRALREAVRRQLSDRGSTPAEIAEGEEQLDQLLLGVNFTDLARAQLDSYFFDPALQAIATDYDEFPLLQARLWQAMADTLRALGDVDRAAEPQDLAFATRSTRLGADHPLTLASLCSRGLLRLGLGQLDAAEDDLRGAASSTRRVFGEHHPLTLESIDALGLLLLERGALDEAATHLQSALDGRRRVLGDRHPETLRSINHLAALAGQRGDLDEAETAFREALAGRRQVFGDQHLDTLESINDMGTLLWRRGELDEAEAHYREALAGYRARLGGEHPTTQVSINNLAVLLRRTGRLDEAEALLRDSLRLQRRLLGDDHPSTLRSIAHLGQVLRTRGALDEAAGYYQEALLGRRRVLGDEHPSTLTSINNLAFVLEDQGRLDDAEAHFREAFEGRRRALGEGHQSTLRSQHDLAVVLRMLGRVDEAETHHRRALEAQRRTLGEEHPDTLRSIESLRELTPGEPP